MKRLKCCVPKKRSEPHCPSEADVLNEEFQCYMRVARSLLKTLKRQKDLELCMQLLRKCERLNKSCNNEVKRYTNAFFKFCLKVLNWTSANQPIGVYEKWYQISEKHEVSFWLVEQKSYLAIKSMCDGSILIYSAVAKDPCAGWVDGGLKQLFDVCEKK